MLRQLLPVNVPVPESALRPSMPSLEPGQLFLRRYRILKAVGCGPLSALYHARDEETGDLVAVKRSGESPLAGDGEAGRRLLHEGNWGLRLKHPHVVRTLEYGIAHDGEPFVLFEWLRGELLLDLLERETPLPTLLALSLVRDAAEGLSALHESGLVHCDVKPENLFLCGAPGRPTRLKVLDLGLARPVGKKPSDEGAVIAGTLQYMPPEQAANEDLDARADIYALGVVLFRVLTGELPFDTRSPAGLLSHHLFSVPPPPSWLGDYETADQLDKIVLTALRKNPQNRYASMADLIADIDRFVAGEPVRGRDLVAEDRFEPSTEHGKEALGLIASTARMADSSSVGASEIDQAYGEAARDEECSAA